MRLKVYDGTASHGENSLCRTCRHATVIRGRTLDEEVVQCQNAPMASLLITFKVTSCSAYDDRREPTYMELMEQAWILQPGTKKRPPGFVRAAELPDEQLGIVAIRHAPSRR